MNIWSSAPLQKWAIKQCLLIKNWKKHKMNLKLNLVYFPYPVLWQSQTSRWYLRCTTWLLTWRLSGIPRHRWLPSPQTARTRATQNTSPRVPLQCLTMPQLSVRWEQVFACESCLSKVPKTVPRSAKVWPWKTCFLSRFLWPDFEPGVKWF